MRAPSGSGRFLLVCAAKDLTRRLRDPIALLMWLGIPVAVGSMLMLISPGDGAVPRAHVLLVDQDESLLSGFLVGAAGQEQMAEYFDIEVVDLEQGRSRIDAGEATALLVVPAGFQDGILLEEPTTLTLVTNPAQRILPAIVREGLEILVEATFYLQRLVGEPLRQIAEGPPEGATTFDNETVAAFSTAFNEVAQGLDGTLFPPVLTLTTGGADDDAEAAEASTGPDFGRMFLPGMLFMSVLFIANGMAGDLWDEREAGTLRRFVSSPRAISLLLAGKMLTAAVLMAGAALLGMVVATMAFGVPASRVPAAIVWTTFVGTCLFTLLLFVKTLSGSQRTAELLGSLIVFPLFMIGGSMFPFEAMPAWMVAIGRWTPNGTGVLALRQILDGVADPASLARAVAAIGVPSALFFWLCKRRVAGRFVAEG